MKHMLHLTLIMTLMGCGSDPIQSYANKDAQVSFYENVTEGTVLDSGTEPTDTGLAGTAFEKDAGNLGVVKDAQIFVALDSSASDIGFADAISRLECRHECYKEFRLCKRECKEEGHGRSCKQRCRRERKSCMEECNEDDDDCEDDSDE